MFKIIEFYIMRLKKALKLNKYYLQYFKSIFNLIFLS